jgi:hypothetical protein
MEINEELKRRVLELERKEKRQSNKEAKQNKDALGKARRIKNRDPVQVEHEADCNLILRFLEMLSFRTMRMIRHTSAVSFYKTHSTGSGLSTEERVGEASRRAAQVVISRGIKMASEITNNVNDEGYFVNAEDLILNFFRLHVINLKSSLLKDGIVDELDKTITITNYRLQVDGFPAINNKPSNTQCNLVFSGFKGKAASQLFCRLLFWVPYEEKHPVTKQLLDNVNKQLHEVNVKSKEEKLMVDEYKLRLGFLVICADWAMAVKLLNCSSAQSVFKGYMTRFTKFTFKELIGKSILEFPNKWIDSQKRKACQIERG